MQKVLVAALVAADTGEAFSQVAADKILPDDIGNNGAEIAVCVGVTLRIDLLEFFILCPRNSALH